MANKPTKNEILNIVSFVVLILLAALGVVEVFKHFGILKIEGTLVSLIYTVKTISICIVAGVLSYKFVKNKSKGYLITYWISLAIVIVAAILLWI